MDKRKELKKSTIVVGTEKNTFEYKIVDVIGDGANSIVYDAQYFGSDKEYHSVRIKECYPYMSNVERIGDTLVWENETQKERDISNFKNAYHKLLKVQNDSNVSNATAHVFDLIEANGTLYSIMDATVGTTFDKDKNNNLIDILKTVCALAKVVGKYHNNGYLHLDIKPSNFLTIEETRELVILFDVDTVTLIDEIQSGKINNMYFSNGWAAPEQMQGKISKLCPATDIFSIGAILFEKTMGRKVLNDDMSPFANWEFEGEKFDKVNPKIKRLLSDVFHKTLSANIKRRFQSCDELIAVLDEAISAASVKTFIVPSCIESKNFIGRRNDLEEIKTLLGNQNNIFVYGFAGTGKTEFAREYAIQNRKEFDTIVFCRYNGSLISSLQRIPVANFEDYKENFKFEFEKLCNDDRLLIILDNFDVDADSEQDDLEYFLNLNCKKIITTRTNFSRRNDAEIYHLECLAFDDALELFKFHSKIHEFSNEDILEIKKIFARVAYNTLFICRLAKEISSRGLTISKLAINVMTDLLKKVGKAEVYKDGKVSNTTIYDLAKILFKLDELSSDQLQVMRNLYMLRWRTVNLAQYREIACFNMDEVTEERTIDTLLYLESRGYIENSQSDASNREIYLHSIVAELIDKDCETTVCNCVEIAKYYRNQIKNVLSNNYAQYKEQTYLELIFEFYKSLNINNKSNFEYLINSIYGSFVRSFTSNHAILSLIFDLLLSKNCSEVFDTCDDSTMLKVVNIRIWFILNSIIADYLLDCFDKWEEPAIDDITNVYEYSLSNPSDEKISYFVEGVLLFSRYFKALYESGRLKKLLEFSTWTFKEKEFLQIQEYVDSLSNYMSSKQKEICKEYFAHNLTQIKKVVEFLPAKVIEESQSFANSDFGVYSKAIFKKQTAILPEIMKCDTLSLYGKIELVKLYYTRCVDSFYGAMRFDEKWNSELEDQNNKYNFLKDFLSNYGESFDNSNDCFNYIRWMYACLSLKYDIAEFHKNMKILMSQLENITIKRVMTTKEFYNIWKPFEESEDFFEYENIDSQLISNFILPYIKEYLSFCESVFDVKTLDEGKWYNSICVSLKLYSERYGSGFLMLLKEYEDKYHNCLGVDYKVTKK